MKQIKIYISFRILYKIIINIIIILISLLKLIHCKEKLTIIDDLCASVIPDSYHQAKIDYPELSHAIKIIEEQPIALWYDDRHDNVVELVTYAFNNCTENRRPTIVVYGIPNKDCSGGFSREGKNKDKKQYIKWLKKLADIAQSKPVVYILEPDAVGLLAQGKCGKDYNYDQYLSIAIHILTVKNKNADTYLDIGFWTLMTEKKTNLIAQTVNDILQMDAESYLTSLKPNKNISIHSNIQEKFLNKDKNVNENQVYNGYSDNIMYTSNKKNSKIKGIALNTSNYRTTKEMIDMCKKFISSNSIKDYKFKCVIDTSRNFCGPSKYREWCNANGTGIGNLPRKQSTNNQYEDMDENIIDYFLWIKPPGESDGYCNNTNKLTKDALKGPNAGDFFPLFFTILWNNGIFVKEKGFHVLDASPYQNSKHY